MSLQDLVKDIQHILPPSLAHVLEEVAKEVDSHSAAISTLEVAAHDVVTESPQAATPAPTVTYTNGEAELVPSVEAIPASPVGSSEPVTDTSGGVDTTGGETTAATRAVGGEPVGNPEQSIPFEEWMKS